MDKDVRRGECGPGELIRWAFSYHLRGEFSTSCELHTRGDSYWIGNKMRPSPGGILKLRSCFAGQWNHVPQRER